MKRIVPLLAGLCLLVGFFATPAVAAGEVPPLPHAFYGAVEINGSPAPVGTEVEGRGTGVTTGSTDNPIAVTVAGQYGGPGGLDPKLVVQGFIEEGAIITFFVNGVSTGQTAKWHSGDVTSLPLSVTIAAPPVGGGGGGGGAMYIETNLFGTTADFRIDFLTGELLKTIEATSKDGNLTITISKGTIALDKDGDQLETLEASVDASPPDPPEGANIIGLAYDFSPDGATFDPAITFSWSYDPDDVPEGVAEEDLVIAYYDEDAGEWVEIPCTVDPVTNTITATVSHFTTFAIIGFPPAAFTTSSLAISPVEVAPGEKVNISISVVNTGAREGSYTVVLKINGVKEAEKAVRIAPGESQSVSFSVAKEAGSYSVAIDGLSGSFTVVAPAPAAFSATNLSIQPAEVQPKETVTITASVANTGGVEGSYAVVLKINGVRETEKSVTVAAASSQDVSFSVTKEEPGSYSVAVDGLTGSFTVAPPPPPPPAPFNWALWGPVTFVVAAIAGFLIFFLNRRRKAY